jgi:hypothetical protein
MADNAVVANLGTGGATFASDQIGGIEYPRAKVVWGADGTATDTSAAAPLPVQVPSGGVASGAIASGAVASGAFASGALASGSVASGALASGSVVDGAVVTLGAKADAKSTATDTTSVSAMSVLKQISASVQAPPSQAVTNAGTFSVQDATTTAAINNSALALGQGALAAAGRVTVVGGGLSASATFTPAAASHVANDCNGAAGTFAFAAISGERVMITDASLEIDGGTAEATAWRLYLYNVTPPSATADDGAWDLVSGDRASFLGYIDLGTAIDLGSTQWVQQSGINRAIKLAGTSVYGYLVNLTTLTPAAVAHIVTLNAVQL